MKKIIKKFMNPYQKVSYEAQGLAKILFFVLSFLIPILILLIISLNVTMKRDLFSLTNVVFYSFFVMLVLCLILLFKGFYNIAANILVIFLFLGDAAIILKTMSYGSVARFIASAIPMGSIVIMGVFFCRKPVYITIFILTLLIFPSLVIKSDLFTMAEKGSVLTGFGLLIVVSSLLSFFMIRINVIAKRRRSKESEDERNEQIEIIKSLIDSLNSISENLDISSLKMTVESTNLSDNLSKQAATTEQITATIEEISAGLESVNNNVGIQDELVNALMDGMDTLSNINNEIENSVITTLNRSLGITEKAEKGEVMLKEMNSSMNEINMTAQEMTGILNIINDISDKINLLSLNASIEAARAGEHGRGFAVVADEIGKLADQTSQSVKEISELVNKSEAEIAKGMQNVSGTVTTISEIIMGFGEINQLVNRVSQKMKEQIVSIGESTERSEIIQEKSNQIKIATGEQKQGALEISNSINYVNELSQSNAQSALEVTMSSSKIETMSHDVNEKIKSLNLQKILDEIVD